MIFLILFVDIKPYMRIGVLCDGEVSGKSVRFRVVSKALVAVSRVLTWWFPKIRSAFGKSRE